MSPLITMGATTATNTCTLSDQRHELRKYSNQNMLHVPKYIDMCTHLSKQVMLSNKLTWGGRNKHKYHIVSTHNSVSGNFLIKAIMG